MIAIDPKHHEHCHCVETWLAAQRGGPGHERLGAALLVGLRALWDRARPTIGEVTLGAIFRRAIDTAVRRHPELAPLGLRITDRDSIEMSSLSAPRVDLSGGAVFLLVEVLRVLARLSAGALTSALHVALTDATVDGNRFGSVAAPTEAPQPPQPQEEHADG